MASTMRELVEETIGSAREKRVLSGLAERLDRLRAAGLTGKLAEYRGKRAEALIAELRVACALSKCTGLGIDLQAGAAHDLRLRGQSLNWTVEVQHKSSVDPFSAIFHPEPDLLAAYEFAQTGWQAAAWKLHQALKGRPFEIQPRVGGHLSAPRWSRSEREEQEGACGQLAEWLVEKLASVQDGGAVQLVHEHARFDVRPINDQPGRMLGSSPLDAFILNDFPTGTGTSLTEWLRNAVLAKSKGASRYPERRGDLHLLGLVVDEAFACTGYPLANTLLGGLNAVLSEPPREAYSYRGISATAWPVIGEAIDRGRGELLRAMAFDPQKRTVGLEGVIFDEVVRAQIDGVVALYYPGSLQFIPNPFSPRDIDPLCAVFPDTFAPFDPGSDFDV